MEFHRRVSLAPKEVVGIRESPAVNSRNIKQRRRRSSINSSTLVHITLSWLRRVLFLNNNSKLSHNQGWDRRAGLHRMEEEGPRYKDRPQAVKTSTSSTSQVRQPYLLRTTSRLWLVSSHSKLFRSKGLRLNLRITSMMSRPGPAPPW